MDNFYRNVLHSDLVDAIVVHVYSLFLLQKEPFRHINRMEEAKGIVRGVTERHAERANNQIRSRLEVM